MESDFCARVTAIWTELVSLLNPFLTFSCCREAAKTLEEEGSLWGVSFLNAVEKTHIYYSGLTGGGSTAMGRGDIGLALLDRDRFGYLSIKDTRETGYLMSFPFELTEEKRLIPANVDHLSANATLRIGLKDENDQPIADYSLEESLPLTVSGLQQPISWKQQSIIKGLARKRVVLEARLQGTGKQSPRLYALYLQAVQKQRSS